MSEKRSLAGAFITPESVHFLFQSIWTHLKATPSPLFN